MKILRIIARLNVGGPARHVVWLTEGLRALGGQTLLVAGVVPAGEADMSYVASAAGVTPITLPEMSREISLKDAVTVWKLYRLMLRERPDIVHTHTAKAGTVGRLAGLMYRWLTPATLTGNPRSCKFVHTYHGHVFHSYYGRRKTQFFLMIERILARLGTDRIVVVSDQQRREINETFRVGKPEMFAVIPLGIDLKAFANWQERRPELRKALNVDDQEIIVGIVGRLTEVKNHKLFLQASARFKEMTNGSENMRRVQFWIIGDGHLRSELEAVATELGLTDDVRFLGTRNDPENFYPALDVVALTSLNEGTPLTLIEAMANARPVIATAVGGVVDLLGETREKLEGFSVCNRGIAVESGDVQSFAQGLRKLVENEALRRELGDAGKLFVRQNYAKERLLTDMSDLYKELLATGPIAAVVRPADKVPGREIASH